MKKYLANLLILLFIGFVSCSDDDIDNNGTIIDDETVVIEDSKPSAVIPSQGFYIVNEDWFGHDDGSVNYFKNDGSIIYRAYRAANNGDKFGVTTQYGAAYGDNLYFVSKQGNRLVVADNKTMKKKAVITDLKGDGRSFLGVNSEKAYIGTSSGVMIFDIQKLETTELLKGISGQVGNMVLSGTRAFVLVQGKGVYVIDTTKDNQENLIAGAFNCMTQSKDGNVWIGAGAKLIKVDPFTLETSEIALQGTTISGSWGAWNAGSLCASTKENVLYWASGSNVAKYSIETGSLDTKLYTLGRDEENIQLAFYASALRVDPISDKLVLIVKRSGWGANGSFNWVHIVNKDGSLEKSIEVLGDNGLGTAWGTDKKRYFWFPAMPLFEDVNAPEILLNQVVLKPNEKKEIYLNEKIVDADNTSASIVKSISFGDDNLAKYVLKNDTLTITAGQQLGKAKLTIQANSNGKVVKKEVRIDVRK